MRPFAAHPAIVTLLVLLLLPAIEGPAAAAPEGTLTWGLHVILASRWLDPIDTEAFINPFMVLYAIHDQAETLRLSRPTGGLIPRSLAFARAYEPPASSRERSCETRATCHANTSRQPRSAPDRRVPLRHGVGLVESLQLQARPHA
jgi:hypothetical protein